MTRFRLVSIAGLVSAMGVMAGCGPSVSAGNSARVSGTISYKGQPIKGGVLVLHSTEGITYQGTISSDGTYQANDVGIGEMVVTVDTESMNMGQGSAKPSNESKKRAEADAKSQSEMAAAMGLGGGGGAPPPVVNLYVKIPDKYKNAKTSPLTITLKAGRQIQNLELD